jgi:hypothetical protein
MYQEREPALPASARPVLLPKVYCSLTGPDGVILSANDKS